MMESRIGTVGIVLGLLLVAATTAIGGAAAVPADAATAPGADATTGTANGTATFGEWVYEVTTGNTTAMTVELENTDTARLAFGGGSVEYAANVTVTDGNGDGQVTLLFDTAAAGGDGQTFAVRDDGDSVTVQNEVDLEGDLGQINLPVSAYVNGTETDAVTILIRDPLVRKTATPTPTATQTPTASPTATTTPGDTTTTTSPGFGIAGGLLALAAAALLARR